MAENPFSTKFWASGALPFQFEVHSENVDSLLKKIHRCPICQIVGPHGSGKSTLLLELLKRHEKNKENVRYLFFNNQHRHIAGSELLQDMSFQKNPFFFVDGFELLPLTDRFRLLFWSRHLIVTAHRPIWFVPVLYRTKPQFSVFVQIVRQRTSDLHEESVLRAVYERSGGNFRTAFFELYDQWEEQHTKMPCEVGHPAKGGEC